MWTLYLQLIQPIKHGKMVPKGNKSTRRRNQNRESVYNSQIYIWHQYDVYKQQRLWRYIYSSIQEIVLIIKQASSAIKQWTPKWFQAFLWHLCGKFCFFASNYLVVNLNIWKSEYIGYNCPTLKSWMFFFIKLNVTSMVENLLEPHDSIFILWYPIWFKIDWTEKGAQFSVSCLSRPYCVPCHWCPYSTEIQYPT